MTSTIDLPSAAIVILERTRALNVSRFIVAVTPDAVLLHCDVHLDGRSGTIIVTLRDDPMSRDFPYHSWAINRLEDGQWENLTGDVARQGFLDMSDASFTPIRSHEDRHPTSLARIDVRPWLHRVMGILTDFVEAARVDIGEDVVRAHLDLSPSVGLDTVTHS